MINFNNLHEVINDNLYINSGIERGFKLYSFL